MAKSLKELIEAKKAAEQARKEQAAFSSEAYEEPQQIIEQVVKAKRSLADIIAAKTQASVPTVPSENAVQVPTCHVQDSSELPAKKAETFSLSIQLNKEQQLAKELAFAGKSFCLIGAAGTGKTTAQREIAAELMRQGKLSTHSFRIQGGGGARVDAPSIAFVAYTRIASGNLRKAIHKDPSLEEALTHNITTIHNLLEYEPEFYWDEVKQKESMRFVPRRNAANPLDITHLVIEESSMVDLILWEKLYAALRPGVQIIFIGDINQLPPVFGASILNYALVQLPVVELTQVYRQAGDSNILENAHRILKGRSDLVEADDFKIMRLGNVQHSQFKLARMIGETFPKYFEAGAYDPLQDIILSPFNKQDLGTDNLNKYMAQFLGQKRNAVVHEIIAGISTLYLAVGDKVMYNKQVGEISSIVKNGSYAGKDYRPASENLTRFGTYMAVEKKDGEEKDDEEVFELDYSSLDLDKMMDSKEDLVKQCSHHVKVVLETGEEIDLNTVGDFAPSVFSLGYALTIHKAQGCEWRKVFIILHKDHSIMAFRELLYTAITRARENCIVIAKDYMIEKAIKNQRIKGNSIVEKIEYFNSGLMNQGNVFCTK